LAWPDGERPKTAPLVVANSKAAVPHDSPVVETKVEVPIDDATAEDANGRAAETESSTEPNAKSSEPAIESPVVEPPAETIAQVPATTESATEIAASPPADTTKRTPIL
jgi:hypothetical protein